MWLWLKTQVALIMGAIGIDWAAMPDGDKLNAVVGVGIGVIGAYLGFQANQVAKRQAQIAEIQHKTWDAIRQKFVDLLVEAIVIQEDAETLVMDIRIYNRGTKSADSAFWHLAIADDKGAEGLTVSTLKGSPGRPATMDNGKMRKYWKGRFDEPIYPKRRAGIATVSVDKGRASRDIRLFWNLSAEDGEFPPSEDENKVALAELTVLIRDWPKPAIITDVPAKT